MYAIHITDNGERRIFEVESKTHIQECEVYPGPLETEAFIHLHSAYLVGQF